MDKKSPDAFRTISEVAEWLGVPTHVLRFWESRFAQVKPVKRAGGRRYYRPADMELLGGIRKLLHDDGMTIRGVQKLLREEGVKHVAAMSPSLDENAMVDVTPSNVVELRKPETPAEPVADRSEDAPIDAEPVEEAEVVTTPAQDADPIPPAPVAADPVPPAPPSAEATPEAPAPDMVPEPEPASEAEPDMPAAAEAPVDAPADPAPAPVQETSAPAAPMQTGFNFGDPESATEDLSQDAVLESSDAVEFHSHGAGFAPPPASTAPTEENDQPTALASDAADPQTAEAGDAYDDPSDLPRLGAADLPLATGELGREAQAAMTPPTEEPPAEAQAEAPEPVALEREAEEAPASDAPEETPALTAEDAADSSLPPGDMPAASQAPTPQEDTPLPPLTAQEAEPVETVADAPAPDSEPDLEPVETAETAAPVSEPVSEPAPEPLESPTAAPAPVDISHIPADPAEEDISPAGPSLAARMRRLTPHAPQGSPAQMRALGDRLQELSGRMKRDAPRRGMQ